MPLRMIIPVAALFIFGLNLTARCQKATNYDLVKLFRENMLDTASNHRHTHIVDSSKYQAVNVRGVTWLKDVLFKEGTIDVDLRGRNVQLRSFVGIAFHGVDTSTYEAVYFCPFRFHDASPVTRKYSLKYISLPDYDFTVLRQNYPGVYENEVNPVPEADDWFHATIVVKDGWITVYVNHAVAPSLKVKKLSAVTAGKIGLWCNESVYLPSLAADFANLTITN